MALTWARCATSSRRRPGRAPARQLKAERGGIELRPPIPQIGAQRMGLDGGGGHPVSHYTGINSRIYPDSIAADDGRSPTGRRLHAYLRHRRQRLHRLGRRRGTHQRRPFGPRPRALRRLRRTRWPPRAPRSTAVRSRISTASRAARPRRDGVIHWASSTTFPISSGTAQSTGAPSKPSGPRSRAPSVPSSSPPASRSRRRDRSRPKKTRPFR